MPQHLVYDNKMLWFYFSVLEIRQKNTQKDTGIYVYIYYIFTKPEQYLVFFSKSSQKQTQDIVFYVLTNGNISVIIIYGRFGVWYVSPKIA